MLRESQTLNSFNLYYLYMLFNYLTIYFIRIKLFLFYYDFIFDHIIICCYITYLMCFL